MDLGGSWHCTGTALALHSNCTSEVLDRNKTSTVLVVHLYCTGSVLANYGAALELHWSYSGTVLELSWYCSGTDVVL